MNSSALASPPADRERDVTVEICVDDLAGVLTAERAGADRVELCANLVEGGTTPSPGMLSEVLSAVTRIGVQVMVRPRGGDFVLDAAERAVLLADVRAVAALARTATVRVGIVLGALLPDGTIDEETLAAATDAAGGVPITFHKAFDLTPDPIAAYAVLARHGVERVLTSGGAATATAGADVLAKLARASNEPGAPVVLAGGGVRAANVSELIRTTGVREVHLRAQSRTARGHLITDEGIVRETLSAVRDSTVDTPTPPAAHAAVIALDVGGTTLKGAVIDAYGGARLTRRVRTGPTGEDTLESVRRTVRSLHDAAEAEGLAVVGVGVVTPGIVNADTGTVAFASSLGWRDIPLADVITTEVHLPVRVDHDVSSAGVAENTFGAHANASDTLFVAIGTGIAASIISGSHSLAGATGATGELGHIPVVPDGEVCTCGQRGCTEVYFSGAGLARRFLARTGRTADAAAIAASDDPDAVAVWSEGLDALATALATSTLLLDPGVIVIGGGLAGAGERAFFAPLRDRVQRMLAWRAAPPIVAATLGADAGRIGAAMIGFDAAGRSDAYAGWGRESLTQRIASPM